MHNAMTLTEKLNGRWHGDYGVAPCPVCQPEGRPDQDALSLRDGDRVHLVLHCKKSECAFDQILQASDAFSPMRATAMRIGSLASKSDEKQARARSYWEHARPMRQTAVETYLGSRGIRYPAPDNLRFTSRCRHPSGQVLPAMIAKIDGPAGFGIHRTYLQPDGSAKASVEPARAMLGQTRGGAVRLAKGPGVLMVAEGIETALSYLDFCDICCDSGRPYSPYQDAHDLCGGQPSLWSTLSTTGMRGLQLPSEPGVLLIAADGDVPGIRAAADLAARASRLNWRVLCDIAPDGYDWNDVLQDKGGIRNKVTGEFA